MFVPDIGGKVINFAEYRCSPAAPKIWNLPGYFMTEAEAARFLEAKRRLEANPFRTVAPGFNFQRTPLPSKERN